MADPAAAAHNAPPPAAPPPRARARASRSAMGYDGLSALRALLPRARAPGPAAPAAPAAPRQRAQPSASAAALRRTLSRAAPLAAARGGDGGGGGAAVRRTDSLPAVRQRGSLLRATRAGRARGGEWRGGGETAAASAAAAAAAVAAALPAHHRSTGGFRNPWPSAGKEGGFGSAAGGGAGGGGARDGRGAEAKEGGIAGSLFPKVARDRRPPDELLATMLLLSARPDFGAAAAAVAADRRALHVHWLGHATFVLQLQGLTVVTDPVWAARLGPMGPRRLVPPPCEVEDLPARIDVVLLSSACYDHLDKHAVERLAPRVSTWIVPLGVKRIVVDCSVEPDAVTELDWWQEVRLPLGGPGPGAPSETVTVACTPAQNYSPRGDTLWCSFYIRHPHRRVFYCGGSGYRAVSRASDDAASFDERAARRAPSCPAFRDVCQRCGPCDTALLPMGGASPRAQMSAYNMDAVDLLLAHRDLRARRTIAHRWGTFQAGDEGMLDPVRALENAVVGTSSALISEHDVSYLKHGHEHRA